MARTRLQTNAEIVIDPAVFNDAFIPFLENTSRIQILYGGSSSGKSHFVAQRCVVDLLMGGRNYLVCRQVARTMKTSVFAQVERVIKEWGLKGLFRISHTDYTIICSNGYEIVFVGLDDTEKIKSIVPGQGAWTDIWVEEATETTSVATLKQLQKRQRGGDPNIAKRLILTFNPILKTHYIYLEFFKTIGWLDNQTEYYSPEISILKTWHIHNKFLTPSDHADLENEQDRYTYQVYTLGNWGILGSVIFTNWRIEDLRPMRNQFLNPHHGLDFGFANDPAAMPITHYDPVHKIIYFYDELYETGLTNDVLAALIKKKIGKEPVVCDSAEPKSIQELKREGVNAFAALKGKDSIEHGIQWLQQQTMVFDPRVINTINEMTAYHYMEDRNGVVTRKPVDKNNHVPDGTRYAYEKENRGGKRKATQH